MIDLTKYLKVNNAAHILYFFEDENSYLNNMIAYIKAGLERNHHLLLIENNSLLNDVQKRINKLLTIEDQKYIHYIDNHYFYCCYGDFHIHSIIEHFSEILTPFINKKINIRTWAHVEWKEQDDIKSKIEEFENVADYRVNDIGLMSVCAYGASDVSASLQTTMMRSHEYLMTDKEFVRSSLYRN